MGGCCGDQRSMNNRIDCFTSVETKFGLNQVVIREFARRIQKIVAQKQITIQQMGRVFSDTAFGKALQGPDKQHPLLRLLRRPLFQSASADGLERLHLIPLGLLYTRGTTVQKVNILFRTYDTEEEEVVYTTTVKRVIRDLLHISVFLVPHVAQAQEQEQEDDSNDIFSQPVEDFLDQTVSSLFGKELKIDQATLTAKMETIHAYLLNPVLLRHQFERFVTDHERPASDTKMSSP